MINRRKFLKASVVAGAGSVFASRLELWRRLRAQIPGGTLPPGDVDKYVLPLVKPPAMPLSKGSNKNKDKFKIAVRQFQQL